MNESDVLLGPPPEETNGQLHEDSQLQVILTDDFTQEMVFDDLEPIEVPITIGKRKLILREADEAASVAWRNCQIRSARMVDGKFVGMGDLANSEPLLISKCLRDASTNKNIPIEEINRWKSRVVKSLFDRLSKISELDTMDTVEQLEKRITEDTEKLKRLKAKDKSKESSAKKEQRDGQDISD